MSIYIIHIILIIAIIITNIILTMFSIIMIIISIIIPETFTSAICNYSELPSLSTGRP